MITTDTPFTIRKTIADGTWKRIRLQGNILKINNASYGKTEEEEEGKRIFEGLPPSLTIPSNSASASLTIGQMAGIASFEGCLQDVQIGKLPKLSFYREEDLQIPEGLSYWKGLTRRKVVSANPIHPSQLFRWPLVVFRLLNANLLLLVSTTASVVICGIRQHVNVLLVSQEIVARPISTTVLESIVATASVSTESMIIGTFLLSL